MNGLKNYFKMVKFKDLTLAEELVYSVISRYSYKGESRISRSAISQITGIKKLDTITKHTNKLEKLGLITKLYIGDNKKSVVYKLNYKEEPFTIIMNDLVEKLDGLELAFAIRLAGLRYKTTPWIKMKKTEIIKKMKIGSSTFYEYMPRLIDKKVVIELSDCYVLNTNYFPVFQKLDDETFDLIKTALDQYEDSLAHKAVEKAYNNQFIGISDPKAYVYRCLTGEAFIKDNNKNEDILPKEYVF